VCQSSRPSRPVITGQTGYHQGQTTQFDRYSPVEQECSTGTLVKHSCLAGELGDWSRGATCSTSWYRSTSPGQAPLGLLCPSGYCWQCSADIACNLEVLWPAGPMGL
jgi:hypothetical protein